MFTGFWSRMSFVARLGVSAGFALAVAGAAMLYSSIKSDSAWHQRNLSAQGENEVEFLLPAVSEQAVIGDFSTIQQILTARLKRDNIAGLRFVDSGGAVLSADKKELPAAQAPEWFLRLTALRGSEHRRMLSLGGVQYGSVAVRMSPVPAQNRIWEAFLNHVSILTLAVGLDFLGILLILKTGLRPLDALAEGARRFGGGDLSARIPLHGSPEMRDTILAFNRMAEDIQAQKAAIHREKELAQVTLQSIGDAVITTDGEGRVTYLNPVAEHLTDWTTADAAGRPLPEVFNIVNEFSRQPVENPVDRVLRTGRVVGLANHTVLIARDGREFSIEDSAAPIRDREGGILGVVLVFHDVTEKRDMVRKISWQASHDALTGLVNRREFEHRLAELVQAAKNRGTRHALLYIDLDQFKVINDTCGHAAGDNLLRQVTFLMQAKVRETDTLARLGGDEFGVLLENCPPEQAHRIARELLGVIKNFRYVWQDKSFTIGASIGLVTIDPDSDSPESLLIAADTACYAAKDKGRNAVQRWHPEDRDLALRRREMDWVTRVNKALEEERFLLYCQPIVPVSENPDMTHFEILLRMRDEENRLVSPAAFIPAAERYNLITGLDRWVVQRALNWLAAHPGQDIRCAINLSGQSVAEESFLDFLIDQVRGTGIPPGNICFEITETAAISNLDHAVRFIGELRSLGCRFALDDFGSGMSSFSYLKNLPVDYLKIDGAFVREMEHNPMDCAMVEAINHVSHVMGIETIAEFVENDAILDKLKTIGVDYAQGYGIAKPVPLCETETNGLLPLGNRHLHAVQPGHAVQET
jgi:diguanylate cyclase (GGDEF)-like protein/PAS domain S-box-containing protein